MKKLTALMMTALLMLSLAAPALADNGVTELVFWDENAGESRTPYYEELISQFNDAHPDIHVTYEGLPSSSAKEKYDVAIATGTMPDVAHVNAAWGSDFLAQEALIPLDAYFDAWDEAKNINDQYIQLNRALDPQGRLFMITDTVSTPLMWVRSDWFEEAGLGIPATWDEFFDDVVALSDVNNGRYGFSIRGGSGSVVELQHALYAYSGIPSYFDENGICTVNSQEHLDFLTRLVALYNVYTPETDITNGYKEMVAGFDGGSVAMIFHNTGSVSEHAAALQPDQYQPVAFPVSLQDTYTYTSGSQGGYGISATCENPDAAWEFIAFMMSAPSNSYWNMSIGQIPMNNAVLSEDWVQSMPSTMVALSTLSSDKCRLVAQPKYLDDYSQIMTSMLPPYFQAVLAGELSVQEFLNMWADAMTESYAAYRAQ